MMTDIVAERVGSLGRIHLDRPKASNAPTVVQAIDAARDDGAGAPGVSVVSAKPWCRPRR